jgi:hypothetical protein
MGKKKRKARGKEPKEKDSAETQKQAEEAPTSGKSRGRFIWMYLTILFFVAGVVFLLYALNTRGQFEASEENLTNCTLLLDEAERERDNLISEKSTLKTDLEACQFGNPAKSGLSEKYDKLYREKGIKNPKYDIVTDLMENEKLIPYEGANNRPMRFHTRKQVYILSPNRALVNFGDGVNYGWMLLSYKVSDGGKISWKVLDSYCAYYDK